MASGQLTVTPGTVVPTYHVSYRQFRITASDWELMGFLAAAHYHYQELKLEGDGWVDALKLQGVLKNIDAVVNNDGTGMRDVRFSPVEGWANIYFVKWRLYTFPLIFIDRFIAGMSGFYIQHPGAKISIHVYDGEFRNTTMEKGLDHCNIDMISDICHMVYLPVDVASRVALTSKLFRDNIHTTSHGRRAKQWVHEMNEYKNRIPAAQYNGIEGLFRRMGIMVKYSAIDHARSLLIRALKITDHGEIAIRLASNLRDVLIGSEEVDVLKNVGWIVSQINKYLISSMDNLGSDSINGRHFAPVESCLEEAMERAGEITIVKTRSIWEQIITTLTNGIISSRFNTFAANYSIVVRFALHRCHSRSLKRAFVSDSVRHDSFKQIDIFLANTTLIMNTPKLISAFSTDSLLSAKYKTSEELVNLIDTELASRGYKPSLRR